MRDLTWLTFVGATLVAAQAHAQPPPDDTTPSPKETEVRPWTVSLGLGAVGFTGSTANDATDIGVASDLRVTYRVGPRAPGLAIEGAIVRTNETITALGLDVGADLRSWGFEAIARYDFDRYISGSVGRMEIHPFVLAGLGAARFSIEDNSANTSDIANDDNVLTIPLGVGVAGTANRLVLEARLNYDPTLNSDLFRTPDGGNANASLSQWSVGVRGGVAF